jgi:cell division septal protein FtsQ
MPLTSIIALSSIVVAFLLFAVILAWADHATTRNVRQRNVQGSRQRDQRDIRTAAARKTPALT